MAICAYAKNHKEEKWSLSRHMYIRSWLSLFEAVWGTCCRYIFLHGAPVIICEGERERENGRYILVFYALGYNVLHPYSRSCVVSHGITYINVYTCIFVCSYTAVRWLLEHYYGNRRDMSLWVYLSFFFFLSKYNVYFKSSLPMRPYLGVGSFLCVLGRRIFFILCKLKIGLKLIIDWILLFILWVNSTKFCTYGEEEIDFFFFFVQYDVGWNTGY